MYRILSKVPLVVLLCFFVAPWRLLIPVPAYANVRVHHVTPATLSTLVAMADEEAPPAPVAIPQAACISNAPAGTHGITICWNAPTSSTLTGYNVYVSSTSGGPYTKANSALIPLTSDTFFYPTATLGGQAQFFVVRSFDGVVESANSNQVSATAIGNPPPPTGAQAVAI